MDCKSVNYSEARYDEIKTEVSRYLGRVGYKCKKIPFIPISGWLGDNLIEKSDKMNWYKGPCLLEALDSLQRPKRPVDKPLRVTVQVCLCRQ